MKIFNGRSAVLLKKGKGERVEELSKDLTRQIWEEGLEGVGRVQGVASKVSSNFEVVTKKGKSRGPGGLNLIVKPLSLKKEVQLG